MDTPAPFPFRTVLRLFAAAALLLVAANVPASARKATIWEAREIRRFPAPDAFQGVAVDDRAFYAISNRSISKYDKTTGRPLAGWSDRSGTVIHLNSCAIRDALLVCAGSNYPEAPATSSIEFFDKATLNHIGHRGLGLTRGWLTWADWYGGSWWLCYANYDGAPSSTTGSPTTVVEYDGRWRQQAVWLFPESVLDAFGAMSASGGAWGPDGYLYVMGHDRPELYALRLPEHGPVLRHVATIMVPAHGQAFGWDPAAPRALYAIDRSRREVVVARVPPVPVATTRRSRPR